MDEAILREMGSGEFAGGVGACAHSFPYLYNLFLTRQTRLLGIGYACAWSLGLYLESGNVSSLVLVYDHFSSGGGVQVLSWL